MDKLRRALPRMYKTISSLYINFEEDDEKDEYVCVDMCLHDFPTLSSLSIEAVTGTLSLPHSLRHLRLRHADVEYTRFPHYLETLWIISSQFVRPEMSLSPLPLKRLYLVYTNNVPSTLLQECVSTLEHLVMYHNYTTFSTSSVYPRLDTLYYFGSSHRDSDEDPYRETSYSLLKGSVLTHLCYRAFRLPPTDLFHRHATRLVYLELSWRVSAVTENKEEVNTVAEEHYLVTLFEMLTHLKVLQHLVLDGPPFLTETWIKALPSSPLVFPHLRSLTLPRPTPGTFSVAPDTSVTPDTDVSRLECDAETNYPTTLYYSSFRSRTFHLPRLCPSPLSPDAIWMYPFASAIPLSPWRVPASRKVAWTRPIRTPCITEHTHFLVQWCDTRNAVFICSNLFHSAPLYLLQDAVFHTTCPYDDCVCRL